MPRSLITPLVATSALALAAAPVLAGPPATPPTAVQKLYSDAVAAAQKGDYARAEQLCRSLTKQAPDSPAAWGTLGQVLARQGKRAEGIRAMQRAVSLAPTYVPFWSGLAGMQFEAGSDADAAASARQALKLEPNNDSALATLASSLMRLHLYREAVPNLRRLASLRGGLDEAIGQNLVFALLQSKDQKGALDVSRKISEKYPKSLTAQTSYADLAQRSGDFAGAYAALGRARKVAPDDIRVGLNYALCAEAVGKKYEAIAVLNKLATASPKNAAAHFHLGRIYLNDETQKPNDRFQAAEKELQTAAELEPKNAIYASQLGVARMLQGDAHFESAEKAFDSALKLDPKNVPARMGVAYIAEQRKEWDKAASTYRDALTASPDNEYARRRLAGVYLSAGKREDAYHEFWELASRNKKDTRYLKELASFLMQDENWPTARSAYQMVLERNPKDADAMVGIAQTLEKEQRTDDAEKQYLAAIAAAPKNTTAYYLLAELYEGKKQTNKAEPLYLKLIAIDPENNGARWNLARIYMDANTKEGDEKALAMMRQLHLKRGDANRTNYLLGPATLFIARKRYNEAVTEIQKVIREDPGNEELQYALADALARAKRGPEAEEVLNGLIQKAQKSRTGDVRQAKTALAHAYEMLERLDDAGSMYEEVLSSDALYESAREGLVRVRNLQKKPDAPAEFLDKLANAGAQAPNMDAVNSLREIYTQGAEARPERYVAFTKRLTEHYPKIPEALGAAADAILKWNNPGATPGPAEHEAALALYRRVLEIDPKNADASFQIALQLEALGKKEEAIAAYQETIRLDARSQGAVNALKRLGAPIPKGAGGTSPAPPQGGSKAANGEKQGQP